MALVASFCMAAASSWVAPVFAQRNKPAEPTGPRDYRSPHFLVHTDLSPDEAKELLTRLETMIGYVARYWGKPPSGVIECYVAKDLKNWPEGSLDPYGRAKIESGAGVTISQRVSTGDKFIAKAVVYAVNDRGTPQHEAVHAYCAQTFGATGPTWYAEGMAEIGQYWREGELAVNAHPEVIKYLRASRAKELTEIVDLNEITGDSWQNYAWRWALCYLLANNDNYKERFLPLGLAMLAEQPVTFEQTYGAMAREITFEYHFFLKHFDTGYRADLTSWNWGAEFRPLQRSGRPISSRIKAERGWQPAGLVVTSGNEYAYECSGSWKTSKSGSSLSADGGEASQGRLMGVLLKDFELSEPFELGVDGKFIAPGDGRLYVRCQDQWNELADNSGTVTIKLTATGNTGDVSASTAGGASSPNTSSPNASPQPDPASQPAGAGNTAAPRPPVLPGKRPGRVLKVN
jgi:hypothetical protein